jgi:aminocarboxymuconate-semialdehyde decarboxylase
MNRRNFLQRGVLASAAGLLAGKVGAAQPTQDFSGPRSYSATARPKAWLVPQKKLARPVSIDMHTHWAPEGYLKAKAELGQPDAADPVNFDMDRRRKLMDTIGIQTSVLTLGGFRPWVWVTPEQGAHIARVSNDAALEAHTAFPDRFVAGIELNCSDPAGSLTELNRMAGKPGMACVHLPTSLAAREFLFEPAFAPVLARIEALGLPIFLHPLDGEANWFAGHRLADDYSGMDPNAPGAAPRFPGLTNSLGNTLEMTVTLSKLIVNGTLDRYPNLTFIASCGGGALPYASGRLEFRSGGTSQRPVVEYLRRFYYDSLVFSPVSMRYLAQMVGTDRIVLGTDNMYGAGKPPENPHSIIDQSEFTDQDRDLILRGNLKRLLRI